ncbi:hypothetical protein BOTBODRAFT_46840 [Botryobasidium botryosum FD-172 SS1]|uniref:Uncharacterized protein n=1 Tax=Botryobasidium botryosum (strain FD-172 SS1) TaxID=930990 RepID=A0A067M826_BOTB1|nr:hypothetical protein BOTBODRAFT_46840 [Botryobasidium botryosum FD-172 SS1]
MFADRDEMLKKNRASKLLSAGNTENIVIRTDRGLPAFLPAQTRSPTNATLKFFEDISETGGINATTRARGQRECNRIVVAQVRPGHFAGPDGWRSENMHGKAERSLRSTVEVVKREQASDMGDRCWQLELSSQIYGANGGRRIPLRISRDTRGQA